MWTEAYIRRRFLYIPETGDLFWNEAKSEDFNPGKVRTQKQIRNNWNANNAFQFALNSIDANGYKIGSFEGKRVKAHRIIWFYMTGEWPEEVDHINGIKTDNSWVNLRDVDRSGSMKNTAIQKRSRSGIVGVSWYHELNKWVAKIDHNSKQVHIGYFICLGVAAKARREAEIKYGYHENHGRIN